MKKTVFRDKQLFLSLAFISLVVIALRAFQVPLFHDEVRTFNHFVKSGILSPFSEYRAANNHLVNSLLARCSYLVFGDSPFALRLPNVLSYLVYLVFVFRIGDWFRAKLSKWTFYLALLFSFHFISFFGLCRGYGIGFASLAAGIFYLGSFTQKPTVRNLLVVLVGFGLALYSFFSLLLPYLIMLGVVIYTLILHRKHVSNKQWIGFFGLLSALILALGYAIHILLYYKGYGILWFGFLDGFWKNTVISLLQLMYEPGIYLGVLEVLLVLFFGVICFGFVRYFNPKQWISKQNLFAVFLILTIVGVLLMAWIFKVNYPYQRTGLHLYFFLVGAVCFAVDSIKDSRVRIYTLFPFLMIPVHFVASFNLDYISLWQEDTLPYSFFDTMEIAEKSKPVNHKSSLYIEGTAISVWSYGVYKWHPELPVCSSNIDTNSRNYDYIIDRKVNMKNIAHLYDSIDGQPFSDVILYQRKKTVEKTRWKELELDTIVTQNKDQWFANLLIDSLPSSSLWFDLDLNIRFVDYPMHVYVVFSMENPETHEKYSYKFIEMDRLIHWNQENHKIYTELANDLPLDQPVEVKVYLWNRYQRSYTLGNSKLIIYTLNK